MLKLYGSKEKKMSLPLRERVFYIALVASGFFLITSASYDLIAEGREYSAAYSEYEQLREQYPVISTYLETAQRAPPLQENEDSAAIRISSVKPSLTTDSEISFPTIRNSRRRSSNSQPVPDSESQNPNSQNPNPQEPKTENRKPKSRQDPLAGLTEVNSDFVGWISIKGIVDYPVVRGSDNERYLKTTFAGQRNGSGAIFMDYRNTKGFLDVVCIVYGHNMRDGSMFAPLNRYTDPAYLENHNDITVVTSEGEVLTYRIFAAKWIYAWDTIYDLKYSDAAAAARAFDGAPDGVSNFLILSTCTPSTDKDDRIIVYAALIN